MKKVNIVKITATTEIYAAVPAENGTEAIIKAREMFRNSDELSIGKEDVIETAYQLVDVLDSELSQAFEYVLAKQEAARSRGEPMNGQNN